MDERRNQRNAGKGQQKQPGSRQQQQGQGGTRQQQQFETQTSRQPMGESGVSSRFTDQIREHMEVVDQSGMHVGTVDHLEGDRIKLTKDSSGTGEHRYIPCSLVAGIEGNKIRLRERGDTDFGMEADR